jgi:hypothetical protein
MERINSQQMEHIKAGSGHGMEKARKFQDLKVWQKAHQFVLRIYKLTTSFPGHELFGLTSQGRPSVVSIPADTWPVK